MESNQPQKNNQPVSAWPTWVYVVIAIFAIPSLSGFISVIWGFIKILWGIQDNWLTFLLPTPLSIAIIALVMHYTLKHKNSGQATASIKSFLKITLIVFGITLLVLYFAVSAWP